ncbi:hypothetical protein HUJ05_001740 [Dendroctonus ponderosae]|nr:hypothetical protein HUJ05_001740 [Dendroctonus ponderosae]
MTALTLISVVLYSTAMILIIELDALFIPKRMDPVLSARERIILDPKKRPFCNAFTGDIETAVKTCNCHPNISLGSHTEAEIR